MEQSPNRFHGIVELISRIESNRSNCDPGFQVLRVPYLTRSRKIGANVGSRKAEPDASCYLIPLPALVSTEAATKVGNPRRYEKGQRGKRRGGCNACIFHHLL